MKPFSLVSLLLLASFSLCSSASYAQGNTKDFPAPGQYKFIVPKGVSILKVSLWGSGGWGGGQKGIGGKGGFVNGDMNVKEGETLLIIVGTGGGPGRSGSITAIKKDSIVIAIAAAGGNGCIHGGRGGDGGVQGGGGTVCTGNFHSGNSGRGASTNAGGTGGLSGSSGIAGKNGAALSGGTNNAKAVGEGWGGAGWFGGGAAGTYGSPFLSDDPYASGGGGGGCNYTKGLTGATVNNSNGSAGGLGGNSGIYGRVTLSW